MSCGCCEPPSGLTPLEVDNRAGLTAVAYRVGTYASFRATMLERISAAPELEGLTTREDDDPSITVLSLWGAVADVLSFYQERYVNEAFLRTATQRAAVGRLAALIDYRLRPGVAALAWLAFGVEDGKELRVPQRMRVQSVPGQDEQPQTFETLAELHAVAALNRVRVLPPPYGDGPLAAGSTAALLDPGPAGLRAVAAVAARDRILLYQTGSAGRVEELLLSDVRVEEDRPALAWESPLRSDWPDDTPVSKVGRVFRLFGHSAPASAMTPVKDSTVPGGIRWSLSATDFSRGPGAKLLLDSRVEGLTAGTRLVVDDAAGATTLVSVTGVETGAETLGGTTDSVTVVSVTPQVPATADRRGITVYELTGPDVVFWGHSYPRRLTGATLVAPGVQRQAGSIEIGRTLVQGEHRPGAVLRVSDIEPGRVVLAGDAETEPMPATVVRARAVGATISVAATSADAASVRQLGLDPKGATTLSGVVSGRLAHPVVLRDAQRELRVRIGDGPARTLKIGALPAASSAPANALRAALHAVGPEPVWAQSRVVQVAGRLVVFAGGDDAPAIEFLPTEADATTVVDLGLSGEQARPVQALLSAPLLPPLGFTAAAPELDVTVGAIGPVRVSLKNMDGANAEVIARRLRLALTTADPAPGFKGTRVLDLADRLLLLPGPLDAAPAEFLRIDVTLEEPLDLDPATAFLLGNVAAASHGETVRDEIVGDGDASAGFQRLSLRKKPLTYVPSSGPGGTESSLQLLVGGVRWEEVPALYGQPPAAQVFETRTADDGTTVLQFSDGRTAARLPTGHGNVTATYRVGAGLAGRVRRETLTSALDRPPGLRDVANPLAASGGADPEPLEAARENAPTTVRTFGRAVSLTDVADLIRSSGEVAKAHAVALWNGLDRAVHVTVAGQAGGTFTEPDLRRIGAALQAARVPGSRVRIDNHRALPVVLRATIAVDERRVRDDVLAAARAALVDALSFEHAVLGSPLHLSNLYRVLQDVPGVMSSDIDELQAKRAVDRERPGADLLRDGTPAPVQPHLAVLSARPDPALAGHVLPAELPVVESAAHDLILTATGGLDS